MFGIEIQYEIVKRGISASRQSSQILQLSEMSESQVVLRSYDTK